MYREARLMRSPVLKDNPLLWRGRLMINEPVIASHATAG
jgi:hypothetical protein